VSYEPQATSGKLIGGAASACRSFLDIRRCDSDGREFQAPSLELIDAKASACSLPLKTRSCF